VYTVRLVPCSHNESIFFFFMNEFSALLAAASSPPVRRGAPSESGGYTGNASLSSSVFCVSCIVDVAVCGGRIGAGGTFCVRPAGVCEVKSHKLARHDFGPDDSFYVMKTGDIAFDNPMVPTSMVSESLRDEWVGLALSPSEWSQRFTVATNGVETATKVSMEQGMEQKNKAKLFQTPAKTRAEKKSNDNTLTKAYQAPFTPFKLSSWETMDTDSEEANISTMKSTITIIEMGLRESGMRMEVVADYAEHQNQLTNSLVDESFLKTQELIEAVGQAPAGLPLRFVAPNLWGTVGALIDTVVEKRSEADVGKIVNEAIEKAGSSLKLATEMLKDNSLAMFKKLLNRLNILDSAVLNLQEQGPSLSNGGGPFGELFGGIGGEVNPNENDMDDIQKRLHKLEVSSDWGQQTFTHQLGLASLEDATAWTALNFPIGRFGLYMDVFLFLERMAGDSDTDQSSMFAAMDKHVKLKIPTGAEAMALGALRQSVPRLFHNSSSATYGSSKHQSFLSRLQAHKNWSDGGHGMKPWMTARVAVVRKSILQDIANTLSSGSLAYQVAVDALSRSVAWVNLLMTFIDSSYESLHVHSKFTKEQAWSLLTQLVTRIFTDMAKVREGVLMSLRTQDEESTCAAVLWTVFQTHDKMDEFFNANISDHPSVSSEYVKFLASNSGFEQVDKLETQVTKLQKDLTKALEDNATVRRKADSATNLVDTLQRKVNAMEAKVSKLK
jgi:hypothetical protein